MPYKANGQKRNSLYACSATGNGVKVCITEAGPGRGRKRANWLKALYDDLILEFEVMHTTRFEFNMCLLGILSLKLMKSSQTELYNSN